MAANFQLEATPVLSLVHQPLTILYTWKLRQKLNPQEVQSATVNKVILVGSKSYFHSVKISRIIIKIIAMIIIQKSNQAYKNIGAFSLFLTRSIKLDLREVTRSYILQKILWVFPSNTIFSYILKRRTLLNLFHLLISFRFYLI